MSADRVVRRASLKNAFEFSSPEELKKYLQEHPKADKTKHTVQKGKPSSGRPVEKSKSKPPPLPPDAVKSKVKPKEAPTSKAPSPPKPPKVEPPKAVKKPEDEAKAQHEDAGPEEGEGHSEEHGEAATLHKSWSQRLKGLSESATSFVKKAPKAFQNFFADDDFRREAIKEARGALTKAPGKIVKQLIDTAKEEVHEFKTAASGVKRVLSGKKMSKHQKHAFKQVAFHMALAGTAAALAASGPLAGIAIFGQSLAKHLAIKSVSRSLANLHVLEEVGHVGHGVAHLMHFIGADGKKKSVDPDEAMAKLVMACVVKELESLSDKDYTEVLNSMGSEKTAAQRVADRFLSASL